MLSKNQGGDLGALIAVRIKEGRPFEEEEIWTYFIQVPRVLNNTR
jgi:hypothetical protein